MIGIIYCYTSPSGKKYIGQTIDRDRLSKHLYLCNKGVDIPFYRAIRKYGIENFKYEVLFKTEKPKNEIKEILDEKEKYYIEFYDTFKNGYNCSIGGEGNIGYKHTDETKKILSEKTKQQWNDESFRKLVHIANKSKTVSDEVKKKISEHSKKLWKNKDYIEKMKNKCKKKVKCIETGIVYDSIKECSIAMNINSNNISQVCRGIRKSAGKHTFIFI